MLQKTLNTSLFESIKLAILRLLASLSYSPFNVRKWFKYSEEDNIVHIVELLLFYRNLQISDLAFEMLINVARHNNEDSNASEPLLTTLSRAFCYSLGYRVSNCEDSLYVVRSYFIFLNNYVEETL